MKLKQFRTPQEQEKEMGQGQHAFDLPIVGNLFISPQKIKALFSEPHSLGSNGKITGSYHFRVGEDFITIYDWKAEDSWTDGAFSKKKLWNHNRAIGFKITATDLESAMKFLRHMHKRDPSVFGWVDHQGSVGALPF
jgi:hypothetical protein